MHKHIMKEKQKLDYICRFRLHMYVYKYEKILNSKYVFQSCALEIPTEMMRTLAKTQT